MREHIGLKHLKHPVIITTGYNSLLRNGN